MLELRYNGCTNCLDSVKATLRTIGVFQNRHYKVEYHDSHKNDLIYKKRPDYLRQFSGAILYNPDSQHWLDFYDKDGSKRLLKADTDDSKAKVRSLYLLLEEGA